MSSVQGALSCGLRAGVELGVKTGPPLIPEPLNRGLRVGSVGSHYKPCLIYPWVDH